jgi:hypothetical protein
MRLEHFALSGQSDEVTYQDLGQVIQITRRAGSFGFRHSRRLTVEYD